MVRWGGVENIMSDGEGEEREGERGLRVKRYTS